jgi:hypothetical protein
LGRRFVGAGAGGLMAITIDRPDRPGADEAAPSNAWPHNRGQRRRCNRRRGR